jgi:ubiquinone/menaquinone biosynthesis C-methylase UbiE
LRVEVEAYSCPTCQRTYPIVVGIPDFRLWPDPYISFEDEYRKARLLAEEAVSFEALVRFYWEITPDVPRSAAERYIRYALNGEERGATCIEAIEAQVGGRWTGHACLDIGCGTGGFLLAAQQRFRMLVGADVALRWLVIARKRLAHAGGHVTLVCCSAEHLPFPEETFEGVVGLHVLEHTADPQAILCETIRTLKRNGLCFFSTPNRFSLGPEPCVRVWGVGFLPRFLASTYVRLIKGLPYKHIRLLSYYELRRFLSHSGLREWTVSPPRIAEYEQKTVSDFARLLIGVYHAFRKLPIFSSFLRLFAPFLQIVGRK